MSAIEARDLVKRYGSHAAVDGISFEIQRGEVVGFLGPNGAGKTTTMKVLTGFIAPTRGEARIDGVDVLTHPVEARRRVGYLPESAPVYQDMRVCDYLDFIARLRGLARGERTAAVERVARECGLTQRFYQGIGSLSKGFRQRVGLAQALVHAPDICILDEPTTGLDPNQIIEIRNLIREIGEKRTIILSTHILSEVQATCDRVLIIHRGRLVADGTTDEIDARQQGGQLVHVVFAPGDVRLGPGAVHEALTSVNGIRRIHRIEVPDPEGMGFQVIATRDVRPDLFRLATAKGLLLLELKRETSSLEEVFHRLTVPEHPAEPEPVGAEPVGAEPAQSEPRSGEPT